MNEIEEKIQEQLKRQYDSASVRQDCSTTMGMVGENRYVPPTLREALGKRLEHAKAESNKAKDLQELCALLDKNPEISRILNLIEKVGKY